MSTMEQVDGKRYGPVGRCIYCGSSDELTDEHTFPYGLGGSAILPKASCRSCAKITGRFEQSVMRGPMQQVRVFRGIQSRSKHRDAPKHKVIDVTGKDGKKEAVRFSFADAPVAYTCPIFTVPAFLNPDGYDRGIRVRGLATYAFGPTPDEAAKERELAEISWDESHKYVDFARMLAKIAYSSAIAQAIDAGLDPLSGEAYVLPAILGHADDIGRWVGTLEKVPEFHEGHLHRVNFGTLTGTSVEMAEIQIFADSAMPHYGVILGRGLIE